MDAFQVAEVSTNFRDLLTEGSPFMLRMIVMVYWEVLKCEKLCKVFAYFDSSSSSSSSSQGSTLLVIVCLGRCFGQE